MAGSKTSTVGLEDLAKSLQSLGGYAALEDGKIDGIQSEEIKKLAEKLQPEAIEKAEAFLTAKEEIDFPISAKKIEGKTQFVVKGSQTLDGAQGDLLKNLNKAAIELEESVGTSKTRQAIVRLDKKLSGLTGMLETEGFEQTAKNHLMEWEGRPMKGFGRCAGTALCAVGLADGIFRSKTNNGEDRNVMTRFGEIALCVVGVAALVLAGRAHLNETGAALKGV